MKRTIVAMLLVLSAAVLMVAAAEARGGGGYYYIPTFIYTAPPTPTASPGSYENIHKVGIISMLGPNIEIRRDDKKVSSLDVSSWHIDDGVTATLRKYLGGRFEFMDMTADRAAFRALPRSFMRESKTGAWLKTLTNPGVDAYLIVRPADGQLPGSDGLGLESVGDKGLAAWASFEIDIVDAHTFKYVGSAYSRIQTREEQPPQYAFEQVFGLEPADVVSGMNAEELETAHHYVSELTVRALVETIRALRIGVELPPVGDHSIAEPGLASQMARFHTVAVASAIGDEVRLVSGGHIGTGKGNVAFAASAWGIDDRAEAIAREILSRRFTVTSAPGLREAVLKAPVLPDHMIPEMKGLPPLPGVDAYVVIVKAKRKETVHPDLGVLHWTPLLSEETTTVYAGYAISVIDARTLEPVVTMLAVQTPKRMCPEPRMPALDVPGCLIENGLAPSVSGELTLPAQERVHATLDQLLAASIPETLFRLGLDSGPPRGILR